MCDFNQKKKMLKRLDDPRVTVIGVDDAVSVDHQNVKIPIPDVDSSDVVTVDIAHPEFAEIIKCLRYLGRSFRPVNESRKPLHWLYFKSNSIEERRFKRNQLFIGGERGFFATEPIRKGQPILVEKGYTFPLDGSGTTPIGCIVLLDKELSENLSRKKEYDHNASPVFGVSDAQWSEALSRGMTSSTGIGHPMEGECPTDLGIFRWFGLINHSCTPSACFSYDDEGVVHVFAWRDIKKGEEITIQYTMVHGHEEEYEDPWDEEDEDVMKHRWKCKCGITGLERCNTIAESVAFAKLCIARYSEDLKKGRQKQ
jgi:hypothetical protein